jgi:hypothetical protein
MSLSDEIWQNVSILDLSMPQQAVALKILLQEVDGDLTVELPLELRSKAPLRMS